jgi:hypothetical protein
MGMGRMPLMQQLNGSMSVPTTAFIVSGSGCRVRRVQMEVVVRRIVLKQPVKAPKRSIRVRAFDAFVCLYPFCKRTYSVDFDQETCGDSGRCNPCKREHRKRLTEGLGFSIK